VDHDGGVTLLKQQPAYELGLHGVVFRDQNMCAHTGDFKRGQAALSAMCGALRAFPHPDNFLIFASQAGSMPLGAFGAGVTPGG
jgi:hypothetical protein